MIALTIRQPYAQRIVQGSKRIENRSRSTAVRGQFLVHAGGQVHDHYRGRAVNPQQRVAVDRLTRSALLGVVNLSTVHNAETCPAPAECLAAGGFRPTRDMPVVHHWVLTNPLEFVTPIPRVDGQLGFWRPDDRGQHLADLALHEAGRA
jgi:hypothetical protein